MTSVQANIIQPKYYGFREIYEIISLFYLNLSYYFSVHLLSKGLLYLWLPLVNYIMLEYSLLSSK